MTENKKKTLPAKIILNRNKAQELAKSHDFKIVDFPEGWKNSTTGKVTLKCDFCGGEFDKTIKTFKSNPTCIACIKSERQRRFRAKRKQELTDIMIKVLETYPGATIMGGLDSIQGVPNEKSSMICAKGHRFRMMIRSMRICVMPGTTHMKWCRQCNANENNLKAENRKTSAYYKRQKEREDPQNISRSPEECHQRLKESAFWFGIILLTEEWHGVAYKYLFQCGVCGKQIKRSARGFLYEAYNSSRTVYTDGYCCKECYDKVQNSTKLEHCTPDYFSI